MQSRKPIDDDIQIATQRGHAVQAPNAALDMVALTRRGFLKLIGTTVAVIAVPLAGCQNKSDNDASTTTPTPETSADVLLDEKGAPLLAEDGSHLLSG